MRRKATVEIERSLSRWGASSVEQLGQRLGIPKSSVQDAIGRLKQEQRVLRCPGKPVAWRLAY